MSVSVQPRLAGRQPSSAAGGGSGCRRGRPRTWGAGKRGPAAYVTEGPPDFQELSHMSIATISRQVHRPLRDPGRTWTREHLRAVPTPTATTFASPPGTVSENLGVPTLHRTVVD